MERRFHPAGWGWRRWRSSADPRVEADVEQVDDEDADEHADRDHQEDGLHQREVTVGDGDEEQAADPGVAEDTLYEHRPPDDPAEGQSEDGDVGEQGVASRVHGGDGPAPQPI